ncbi:YbaN family protein [Azospirillum brasilense]|uniref:YbaN family protein n=1 Tax=Azospirillum brasilense TaxID=192 RepID=UPI001EDA165B|nr:YbaN family protein [Azospirillum brasilense]UKJ73025.1 YbaN family protein [Azospirillum brasilense]
MDDQTALVEDAPVCASPLRRRLWLALGYAAVGLGIAGTVLPLLPTTPFLLLAAGAFAKSSPALRDRLYRDPRFGPLLRDWQSEGAIPRKAKAAALIGMSVSWAIVVLTASRPLVPILAGTCMAAVAIYIVTRPSPSTPAAEDAALDGAVAEDGGNVSALRNEA